MKVFIEAPVVPFGSIVKIYMIEENPQAYWKYAFGATYPDRVPYQYGHEIEPSFTFPVEVFNSLTKAIVEYANSNNIKTESESKLQGKLIATEKHLEDMRRYLDIHMNNLKV